jgi:sulfatase maturation enzyme AslB (radical SAM superfamily)
MRVVQKALQVFTHVTPCQCCGDHHQRSSSSSSSGVRLACQQGNKGGVRFILWEHLWPSCTLTCQYCTAKEHQQHDHHADNVALVLYLQSIALARDDEFCYKRA